MAGNRSASIPPPVLPNGADQEAAAPVAAEPIKRHDPIASLHSRKGPIEVLALAKGLYQNRRIDKGEKFQVREPKHLGSWMKCVDPTIQKEHEHYCKAHKKKMQSLEKLVVAGD